VWDEDETAEWFVSRLTVQVPVAREVVVYGMLPLAHGRGSGESQTDPGNITLGGRWVRRGGDARVGLGAAIALPTAPEVNFFSGSDSGAAAYGAAVLQFDRVADFLAEITAYRLLGDLRFDRGGAFAQLEAGYDRLEVDGADEGLDVLHLDVGAGVHVSPRLALLAEFTTLSLALEDEGFDEGEKTFHALYAGGRYAPGRARMGLYLFVPVDIPIETANALGLGFDVVAPL
jgi:hypothetical protein